MLDALKLIVDELINEDLTADEFNSLTKEISKHSGLVDSLRSDPIVYSRCIVALDVQSQLSSMIKTYESGFDHVLGQAC